MKEAGWNRERGGTIMMRDAMKLVLACVLCVAIITGMYFLFRRLF